MDCTEKGTLAAESSGKREGRFPSQLLQMKNHYGGAWLHIPECCLQVGSKQLCESMSLYPCVMVKLLCPK